MYYWRSLSQDQRNAVSEYRRINRLPKHSPPHFDSDTETRYLLTAACYEHKPIIGTSPERMSECETAVIELCAMFATAIYAWCFLPNHFHVLLSTARMSEVRAELGRFNGRSAFKWNGEDDARGRKVWHNCFERKMRSERHFFASLNYVLNNAVHHGHAEKWQEWPWSNAAKYLETMGEAEAKRIWLEYPVLDYGKKWDVF